MKTFIAQTSDSGLEAGLEHIEGERESSPAPSEEMNMVPGLQRTKQHAEVVDSVLYQRSLGLVGTQQIHLIKSACLILGT